MLSSPLPPPGRPNMSARIASLQHQAATSMHRPPPSSGNHRGYIPTRNSAKPYYAGHPRVSPPQCKRTTTVPQFIYLPPDILVDTPRDRSTAATGEDGIYYLKMNATSVPSVAVVDPARKIIHGHKKNATMSTCATSHSTAAENAMMQLNKSAGAPDTDSDISDTSASDGMKKKNTMSPRRLPWLSFGNNNTKTAMSAAKNTQPLASLTSDIVVGPNITTSRSRHQKKSHHYATNDTSKNTNCDRICQAKKSRRFRYMVRTKKSGSSSSKYGEN
jgi:hypothetical protein